MLITITVRALIIEDDLNQQQQLQETLLKNHTEIEVVGTATSVYEATISIISLKPDLVFADIEIAGGSCFQVFEKLASIDFGIIFITAFNEHAIRAFKLNAIDYLLKPINPVELANAIHEAKDRLENREFKNSFHKIIQEMKGQSGIEGRISISTTSGFDLISIQDITLCRADKNYTEFFLYDGQRILSSKAIKGYNTHLERKGFIRVHKSYLANMRYVKNFNKLTCELTMINGEKVPVARRRKDELIQLLS